MTSETNLPIDQLQWSGEGGAAVGPAGEGELGGGGGAAVARGLGQLRALGAAQPTPPLVSRPRQ